MRLMVAAVLSLVAAVVAAPAARAQESDEALKKRIMDKVRERMAEEHQRILERISKVIDAELAGGPKSSAPSAPAPAPVPGPAAPVAPKTPEKEIRDLERKLQALDDQREDLLRDIRGIRRETQEAALIKDAEAIKRDIEDAARRQDRQALVDLTQEVADEFKSYLNTHDKATKLLATNKEESAKEFEKSIAGFKRLYYGLRSIPAMKGTAVPSAYNVACGYALSGKNEQALDWLWISIKIGYEDFDHMRQDSDLDGLRKERRYLRLLADR